AVFVFGRLPRSRPPLFPPPAAFGFAQSAFCLLLSAFRLLLSAFSFLPTAFCLPLTAFRLPPAPLTVCLTRNGARNSQLAHLVAKRGPLESQPLRRSSRTTQDPLRLAQGPHNLFAFALGERARFALDFPSSLFQLGERNLKGWSRGKNGGALDKILQLPH